MEIQIQQEISMGQDSIVGIAMCYRLGGPGIESQWRKVFLHVSRMSLGPIHPPVQWVSFPGIKQPGCEVNYSPQANPEIKERLEL